MATSSRRRTAPAAAQGPASDAPDTSAPGADLTPPVEPAAPAPKRRRKPAAELSAPEATATAEATPTPPTEPAAEDAPARKPRRRAAAAQPVEPTPREPLAAEVAPDAAPAEAAPADTAAPAAPAPAVPEVPAPAAAKPKRPARKKKGAEAEPAPLAEALATVEPTGDAAPALTEPVLPAVAAVAADSLTAAPAGAVDAEAITAATTPAAADPAPEADAPATPEPAPQPARIVLASGLRRLPVWQSAQPPSRRVNEQVARWQTGVDGALALADADALAQLLAQLARSGEPVEVDAAVWTQLALRGDLHRRIDHLSALYPQGLDGVQLPEAAHLAPPQPCQLEAAFYAACVGACLIADEPPLQPLREALLAWQLVQRHFGAQRLAICTARPGDWQALLPAGAAATIQWCAPGEPLAELALDALIIDQREVLGAVVPALPEAPWCWVIAPSELLVRRERAVAWLSAVDRVGAGALADWVDGASDEVLTPLMLRRRFADVAEQWPAWAPGERAVEHTDEELATLESLHQTMRPLLARWQRSGFLSDTDQLALQRTLRAREHLARAAAIGALAPLLHKAVVSGAQRAVVFSADAGFLGPLAELLRAEDLPCQVLPIGADADAALRAYRDADGAQVLLVADELDGPRIATQPHRPVVVALDGAGDEPLRQARLARVRTARVQREVPVWQLCAAGVPTLPAAPAHGLLRGEALQAWLQALAAALLPPTEPAPAA